MEKMVRLKDFKNNQTTPQKPKTQSINKPLQTQQCFVRKNSHTSGYGIWPYIQLSSSLNCLQRIPLDFKSATQVKIYKYYIIINIIKYIIFYKYNKFLNIIKYINKFCMSWLHYQLCTRLLCQKSQERKRLFS